MKILGRIKKSKVLTAVMTAVLIFQSACPTGLAYAAQKSGVSAYAAGQTIDQALGATKTVESVLSQHENDEYYLTTPYGNKGPHGEGGAIDTWDCWKPKGEYGSGAYMNCAGFVVAVLRACGANTSIIGNYTAMDGYNRGNETNASKWDEYCRDNNAVSYTFSSKEQMLASGILEKGDIIYMEPADWNHSNSDCHIGFFWGSNSSEDLFWHSSSHADGIVKGYFPNSAGGNVISKITPKYPVRYYRVIKTLHKGYLTLHKDSSNKTLTDANDCYSLAGAEYGVYTDSNCSNKVATLTTNVSGNANTVSLNPGRYYVKETKAPKGYFTDSQVYTADVSGANRESSPVKLSVSDNPANDPMSMLLGKFDGQKTYNGAGNLPQGSATLAGAEFTVDYYATLDYKSYDDLKNADVKPMRSWTFSTDSNGFCSFDIAHFVSGDAFWYRLDGTPALPRGTVVIRETKAPMGYVKSDEVSFQKIQENNSVEGVITYNAPEVAEQVYRSDIEFTKKADNGSDRLAGVPFKVTSLTTGESHIAVTDENGYFSSASSWNAHDSNTNANDWALTASDTIDSTKLDANAGFWFGNNSVLDGNGTTSTSDAVKADNKLGALPFDTYSVEELRCSANEGYALINTTVTVTRDAKIIDLGTFDDPEPEIHTTAKDGFDGNQTVVSDTEVSVVDTVKYKNVTPGKTYKVSGTLYEKVTDKDGKVTKKQLLDADGNPVTAETEFVPETAFGDVDVTFTFDASDLKAKDKVVAFESLSLNGKELASHADIEDKSQTVTITKPEVGTTAKDGFDGNQTVVSDTEVSVVDTVKYKNVTPGKTYKVSGTLYEKVTDKDGKVTKKQLLDADGNPVTAETEFVPEDTYGTVDVTFTFDGSLLKDNTPVVAFESLSYKDKEIASHSDIEDEDQTVTMHTSEIGTTATDKLDGDKTVIADAESTVTDKVEYDHVLTGKAYTMAGILMDAKTGLPVLTGEGAKKYTEDDLTKFTSGLMNVLGFQSNTYSIKVKDKDWGNGAAIVKNADGSYTYDASERTENEDGTWTVKTDTQTLTEQEDGTWKLTGLEGSGSATADGGTSFVRNIEETYKADEVEVTDNGIDWSNAKKLPTASIDLAKVKAYAEENKDLLSCLVYKTAEFTPEKESGSIDMDYTFNSNDVIDRLSGETKNLVVFEVMFKGSIENASDETPVSIVASECDKDNEGQTVKLAPSTIGTTATDKSDGDHELMAGKDAVITDEVKYEGLIPGKEYTLHATLMDKKTGEPLKVADKGVTAELKFTPNSESGTVSINLGEFDATSLDGHTLVVFEELTKQSDIDGKATDVTVAEHKDINDEGQSVTVTSTPAGSTYGKTGVDMTNIAIAIGILLIAAGCATAYGIKSRKTTKGDADESAEDNTEA